MGRRSALRWSSRLVMLLNPGITRAFLRHSIFVHVRWSRTNETLICLYSGLISSCIFQRYSATVNRDSSWGKRLAIYRVMLPNDRACVLKQAFQECTQASWRPSSPPIPRFGLARTFHSSLQLFCHMKSMPRMSMNSWHGDWSGAVAVQPSISCSLTFNV